MTRKSIINAINAFVSMNNLKWVNLYHFQCSNPEQTCITSWSIEEEDYVPQQNEYEYEVCQDFHIFNKEELLFILDSIKTRTGREIYRESTDTFGEYAGIPYFYIYDMEVGFWYAPKFA